MSVSLVPNAEQFFVDEDGKPYAGGTVLMCLPGTLTLKATFTDEAGTISNLNPVPLDAAGRCIMWGNGDYRQLLYDSVGNQIWDRNTSCALPDDVISAVMLPIVGALSLQQARDLLGVTQAIQDAVSNLSLLKGDPGIQGPVGPQGPKGDKGDTGSASTATSSSAANPGYWYDPNTNFLINFGKASVDGGGGGNIFFAKDYTNQLGVVITTVDNGVNVVIRAYNITNRGFTAFAEDTDNHGGISTSYSWVAHGFAVP